MLQSRYFSFSFCLIGNCIPKAGWDAKKLMTNENEREFVQTRENCLKFYTQNGKISTQAFHILVFTVLQYMLCSIPLCRGRGSLIICEVFCYVADICSAYLAGCLQSC